MASLTSVTSKTGESEDTGEWLELAYVLLNQPPITEV